MSVTTGPQAAADPDDLNFGAHIYFPFPVRATFLSRLRSGPECPFHMKNLPRLQCHVAGLLQRVGAAPFADEHEETHRFAGLDVGNLFSQPVERINLFAGTTRNHYAPSQARL